MKEEINELIIKLKFLSEQQKFDEIIELLTDEVLNSVEAEEKNKAAELYTWKGNAWYDKKSYDDAIKDYNKAIEINQDYTLAFYNKAQANIAKKDYEDAIKYLDKVIKLDSKYAEAYISRGHIKRVFNEDYIGAIDDYTQVIIQNLNDRNAYYYRGLTYYRQALKEENNIDSIKKSKDDFKEYLRLPADDNDNSGRYAKYYLKKLDEINDTDLSEIIDLVFKIKEILRINDDYIIHYTTLSAMKILILTDNSRLWIFEGNFMNDSSEGNELFSFLYGKDKRTEVEAAEIEIFVPKPFIGSFVPKDKHNDLNMWRFYGKEDGVEAKGCAIVLRTHEFIEDIKNSLSNEQNKEARIDDESDISFYRVVYLPHKSTDFKIPNLEQEKVDEFKNKMNILKKKVTSYSGANKANLEEYLNNIAFLFKRADYENENEVRLVMTGVEFEKKFYKKSEGNQSVNPPRVYIELEPIRKSVEQITLGPKVEKANEWASTLHYSYKKEEKVPKIMISHLPYK